MFNKHKLARFCAENHVLLVRLAYSWCHDKHLAEDIVQDATEKSLKKIHQLDDIKAVKAWFVKIMLNCLRDDLRKQRALENFDEVIISESAQENDLHLFEKKTPEDLLSNRQTKIAVQSAISRLPLKYKTVITLIDIYGVSYSEVSTILDIPIGTVMSRLSRARSELVKRLSVAASDHTVVSIKK